MTDRNLRLVAVGTPDSQTHLVSNARYRLLAVLGALLAAALLLTLAIPLRPLLVWNVSASAPIGLYSVTSPHDIAVGEMVIARLPARWRPYADARRYVPANVPVVKRVAATAGDRVCARRTSIMINGRLRGHRAHADGHGRPLPWWRGCFTLRNGAVFLLNDNQASFDGRYVGATLRGDIIGRAHPLCVH